MDPTRLTPAQKAEYRFFYDATRQLDLDLRTDIWARGQVPPDWLALMAGEDQPARERVTLRLDADLVRFFRRRWGQGYQAQVNRVLRAFFKLHMSKLARGPDSLECVTAEAGEALRPAYGDAERRWKGKGLSGGLGAG